MKDVLNEISALAIRNADITYTQEQMDRCWIGFDGATSEEVSALEHSLGLTLPEDYKAFLLLTNGFSAVNDSTEPSFAPAHEVDYLINRDKEMVDIWLEYVAEIGVLLSKSILVAGFGQEQFFLLIPPDAEDEVWRYWKFASWIPGEQEFADLHTYFLDVLDFLKKET